MHFIVLLFAVFIVVAGATMLVKPKAMFGALGKYSESLALHVMAIVLRLLLGGVLLVAASGSKFPLTLEVIGWVSIVAAIVLALIGHRRFVKLMTWVMGVPPKYGQVIGIIGIIFGVFLGYAVV